MALCTVDDVPGITLQALVGGRWILGLATGLFVAAAQARRGWGAVWLGAGIAVATVPAWSAFLGTVPDLLRTFCAQGDLTAVVVPGQTVPATPRTRLSEQYIGATLLHVGHALAGGLLVWRGLDPDAWRRPSLARMAAHLAPFVPMRGGEARSLRTGVALFPLLVLANLALLWLIPKTGDDSAVFTRIAPLQVVMLALAAGVGEEITYRVVMQQGLKRLMPGRVGLVVAVLAQAIVFAYAHTGYKDLQHLQFAFYFAILAGAVVEWLGLWAAIALHVLIDAAAFASAAEPTPGIVALAATLATAVLAVAAWEVGSRARLLLRRGPAPGGGPPRNP